MKYPPILSPRNGKIFRGCGGERGHSPSGLEKPAGRGGYEFPVILLRRILRDLEPPLLEAWIPLLISHSGSAKSHLDARGRERDTITTEAQTSADVGGCKAHQMHQMKRSRLRWWLPADDMRLGKTTAALSVLVFLAVARGATLTPKADAAATKTTP